MRKTIPIAEPVEGDRLLTPGELKVAQFVSEGEPDLSDYDEPTSPRDLAISLFMDKMLTIACMTSIDELLVYLNRELPINRFPDDTTGLSFRCSFPPDYELTYLVYNHRSLDGWQAEECSNE